MRFSVIEHADYYTRVMRERQLIEHLQRIQRRVAHKAIIIAKLMNNTNSVMHERRLFKFTQSQHRNTTNVDIGVIERLHDGRRVMREQCRFKFTESHQRYIAHMRHSVAKHQCDYEGVTHN